MPEKRPSWRGPVRQPGVCPVRIFDRLWSGWRLKADEDRDGPTMISRVFFVVAGAPPDALLFVFALAHFGCGVAASGVRAALNGCLDGLAAYPRNWGASSYITSDMPREATQEFGCWKTPEVMGEIYSNVQTEELVAEVPAVLTQYLFGSRGIP